MDEENKKLFEELDKEISEESIEEEMESEDSISADEIDYDGDEPPMITPSNKKKPIFGELSDKEVKEVIMLSEDKEKVFTIESAEIIKPKLYDDEGKPVEPKPFSEENKEKKGFVTKLRVVYKDNNYVSLIPNVKWYLRINEDGTQTYSPWFRTKGLDADALKSKFCPVISKLYHKYCLAFEHEVGKFPQASFVKGLVGKKVKLEQWSDDFKNKKVYRIDIKEFVK